MNCTASNKTLTENIKEEERRRMAEIYTVLCLYNAVDKCHLCENTAFKLVQGILNDADSINKNYTELKDYKAVLDDEYGIKFVNQEQKR